MEAAKVVVDNRVNGLGVAEPLVQRQGEDRIIVELPGIENPDQAIATLRGTGLLEFVEAGRTPPLEGTILQTDFGSTSVVSRTEEVGLLNPATGQPYHTLMTGADLKSAQVAADQTTGLPVIAFELNDSGREVFREYTRNHIGDVVAITMDKQVLSAPVIRAVIDGSGEISGGFTQEQARGLAVQMQYGALPVPLRVIDARSVGATLGADSVRSSIIAGVIGLSVVLLFMLLYYRLPGLLADFALIIFVLLNLALYELIPITLTLPGIAGFLLATGTAVDANVLIFERMKEELRNGKPLKASVEAGFNRAWTSILDSNLSTLITCGILYFFGGAFGASSVRGFALTLFLGVLISMFTAVFVTRTFMRLVFERPQTEQAVVEHAWIVGA
jgi:protein-export membrane protein SecD